MPVRVINIRTRDFRFIGKSIGLHNGHDFCTILGRRKIQVLFESIKTKKKKLKTKKKKSEENAGRVKKKKSQSQNRFKKKPCTSDTDNYYTSKKF